MLCCTFASHASASPWNVHDHSAISLCHRRYRVLVLVLVLVAMLVLMALLVLVVAAVLVVQVQVLVRVLVLVRVRMRVRVLVLVLLPLLTATTMTPPKGDRRGCCTPPSQLEAGVRRRGNAFGTCAWTHVWTGVRACA